MKRAYMIEPLPKHIEKKIKRHFKFLLKGGYKIKDSIYTPPRNKGGIYRWEITISSPDCSIRLASDRGNDVYLGIAHPKSETFYSINVLIYFVTNGKVFIPSYGKHLSKSQNQQLKRLAGFLKDYLKIIVPYIKNDFNLHKDDIEKALNDVEQLDLEAGRAYWRM